jgi:predicted phage terminase large subunit-like protein
MLSGSRRGALFLPAQRETAKQSFYEYVRLMWPDMVPARHHRLLIDKLQAVSEGRLKRLMVFMPPGYAKSTYSSIHFPAWWIGKNPRKSIIMCSYDSDLAVGFGRRVRNIVGSDEYANIFGFGLRGDSKSADSWAVDAPDKVPGEQGGEYKAVGVGSGITGRRADLGLIDDPIKGRAESDSIATRNKLWDWYRSDFRTRLKPGAAVVLVNTRWHEDDLAGRILPDKFDGRSGVYRAKDGEEWDVLSLQALAEFEDDPLGRSIGEPLWPEFFDLASLLQERESQGSRNWESLFQQRPTTREGTLFKVHHISMIETAPADCVWVRRWDFAATEQLGSNDPDWTVGLKMGRTADNRYIIGDIVRFRGSPLEVENALVNTAAQDGKTVTVSIPQDPGQAGKAQVQYLTGKLSGYKVKSCPETGSKEVRAEPFASQVEAGNVYVVRGHWNAEYLDELAAFPSGKKKDQVDASSGAFTELLSTRKPVTLPNLNHMSR